MADVIQQHIELVQGSGGAKARIAGHRIRVQDVVVWHEKSCLTPDEIVDQYPSMTLADVHAALAYYWDHRGEIEQAISDEMDLVAELRRQQRGPMEAKLTRDERE